MICRDCNPGSIFSIPGSGIEEFVIPESQDDGSRRDYRLAEIYQRTHEEKYFIVYSLRIHARVMRPLQEYRPFNRTHNNCNISQGAPPLHMTDIEQTEFRWQQPNISYLGNVHSSKKFSYHSS